MLMQEQGTKMYVDAVLKTHERVVQVKFNNKRQIQEKLTQISCLTYFM